MMIMTRREAAYLSMGKAGRPIATAPNLVFESIPRRYHGRVSTQIAVRLPDDLVEFVDELVRHGKAPSRAAVVARALRRERRQAAAARDAAILSRTEPEADLDRLAEHAAPLPMDDLD